MTKCSSVMKRPVKASSSRTPALSRSSPCAISDRTRIRTRRQWEHTRRGSAVAHSQSTDVNVSTDSTGARAMKKLSIGSWAYVFNQAEEISFHTILHRLQDL